MGGFLLRKAGAALIVVFLSRILVLLVFRAMPGEDESVSHETIEHKFDAHAALGDFLAGGAILLLILILIAWTGRRSIGLRWAAGEVSRRRRRTAR